MINLTGRERNVLLFCTLITIGAILTSFILSFAEIKFLIIGTSLTAEMALIGYIYVISPMKYQSTSTRYYNKRIINRNSTFAPNITPPPPVSKKTVLKGKCDQCSELVLMGFTCSYCHGYFCTLHRLPEKHSCPALR
ncbi:MAG: hypothetical protein EAX86_00505 [Candidatus Heimdallarchaeota archaeon]|nr:hypothetical protein [Candidatus Heimdallarchaeota archaeon]